MKTIDFTNANYFRYFKNKLSIICEFIPQVIFLTFLFLYMVLLMFLKWIIYYPTNATESKRAFQFFFFIFLPKFILLLRFLGPEVEYSPHCAPSILITFINMVLFKETKAQDPEHCEPNMFAGQMILQPLLVVCAFICVPWMLLAKPIYIMRNQRKLNYSVSVIFEEIQSFHS